MKKIIYISTLCLLAGLLFNSCQQDTPELLENATLNLPETHFNYADIDLPSSFGSENQPNSNVLTDAGATLGRVLFYDKALSLNNKISCGSCHIQSLAFADGKAFSEGFDGRHTTRNSMALINLGHIQGPLFWDHRNQTLEEQALQPVKNHIEMGIQRMEALQTKLKGVDYYPALFEDAFGSEEITANKIAQALAQFMRSILSYQSKYDIGLLNNFSNFSELEMEGLSLFHSWDRGCVSCHGDQANLSGGGEATNIGLDMEYDDKGLYEVTGNDFDKGRFKIPSLRNVALTAPYMHDGRYETLEDVVEHYNSKVELHPNLDWRLFDFFDIFPGEFEEVPVRNMNLTQREKDALVAFMHTLTDHQMLKEEKFSSPF